MKYCVKCGKECDACCCAPVSYARDDAQESSWSFLNINPFTLLMGLIILAGVIFFGMSMRPQTQSSPINPAQDRYLSVRVNVDQEVNADYVIWRIGFQNTGNDIKALQEKFQKDRVLILDFLKNHGFTDSEISIGAPRISDQFAREWGQADVQKLPDDARYILNSRIRVSTSNIQAVEIASREQDNLLKDGVIITRRDGEANPRYLLRNRVALERDLYALAIQKAHTIALQLAQGMNARIINVRNTTQEQAVRIIGQGSEDVYYGDSLRGPIKRALLDMVVTYNIE